MVYNFSFRSYRLPLRTPLRTAHGWWAERDGIIVRLEDEQGRVGFGEIAPIPWFGTETLAEAGTVCGGFGAQIPAVVLDAVPERFGCVRFALAMARDEMERGPRARLGESKEQKNLPEGGLHALSARLPVAALLPAGPDVLPALALKLEAGFLAFKWKVGVGDVEDELGLLDDLLSRLPAYAKLRLDANGAWSRRQAAQWLERCADRPIEFVEQPVAPAEEDTLLGLARDYPVTLALDESIVRLPEARRWQALGWPGVFVVKPALAGPLPELIAWIGQTKADVVFSSAIETALGRSVILQAALGHSLTTRALGFGVGEIFGDRRWDGPVLGPLADRGAIALNPGEAGWNALN